MQKNQQERKQTFQTIRKTPNEIIFLDIDGVLKEEDYDAEFKDECFARLKKIVDATGAEIILSSSWRIHYWEFVENVYRTDDEKLLDLYSHFEKYGLKVAGRTDYTIRSGPSSRPVRSADGSQTRRIWKTSALSTMRRKIKV